VSSVSGDIHVDVDVKNTNRVGPALQRGLKEGVKESGEWLLDSGEDKAKDVILSADRVWRKTLKHGFRKTEYGYTGNGWHGKLLNEAPHAEINENGLKPGSSPSVQDIIPWVDDNMVPNASAQASAEAADVGSWTPELQALAGAYSPGIVITSFAVKNELEKNGYPGIGFMETTEQYLQRYGKLLVEQKVEKQMERELRAAGLK